MLFGDKTIFIHIIHVLAVFYKLFLDYFAIFIQIVTVSGITVGYECRSSRGSETVFVKIIISAVNFYTLLIHKNLAVFIDIKLFADPAGYFKLSVRLIADIISILIEGKIILLLLLIYSDLTACSCKFVDGFIIGNKKRYFRWASSSLLRQSFRNSRRQLLLLYLPECSPCRLHNGTGRLRTRSTC